LLDDEKYTGWLNSNNDNNNTTIYKAPYHVHEVTTRAPYNRFTRWMQNSARRPKRHLDQTHGHDC